MARFRYEVVADKIQGSTGGFGPLEAEGVTTHHTAVATVAPYDIMNRLAVYARYHGGKFPYHFYIPMDDGDQAITGDEDVIYITNWLNQFTVHNSNWDGNRKCLAVVFEGNHQVQKPTELQLAKYKQLMDDLASGRFYKELGFIDSFKRVNPRDNSTILNLSGVHVKRSHYHNEVAQPGNATACCGVNLIPYVVDYRDKAGNITWGAVPEMPTPEPAPVEEAEYVRNSKDIPQTRYVAASDINLIDIAKKTVVQSFEEGSEFDISRITSSEGVEYAITPFSALKNIWNGLPLSLLIKKEDMDKLNKKIEELETSIKNDYLSKEEVRLHYIDKAEVEKTLDEKNKAIAELTNKLKASESNTTIPVTTEEPNTWEYKFTKWWNTISPRIRYYWPYITGFIAGLAAINYDQDPKTVVLAVIAYIGTYIFGLKAVEGIAKDQKKALREDVAGEGAVSN